MHTSTFIPGKDAALGSTIQTLQGKLPHLGVYIEERSWLNPGDGIWSVHIRDRDCPLLFASGKGAPRLACLASALGEFFERLSANYFWTHFYFEVALERALTELLKGRALDALSGFTAPDFDLEEAASSTNIEIHVVDSSGVIHWKFLGDTPDFDFADWNFSNSTAEDDGWCVQRLHADRHDIDMAEFTHLGVCACRILVPGLSEIYPIDDLEFENNSIVNPMREVMLNLTDLDEEERADLLETFNETNLADHRSVPGLIGLAADAGSFWANLRLGELKTLLALAIGDESATLEGCDSVLNFGQINPQRRQVYACIRNLIQLSDMGEARRTCTRWRCSTARVRWRRRALIMQEDRFMGLSAPGLAIDGCELHHKRLQAYANVHAAHG